MSEEETYFDFSDAESEEFDGEEEESVPASVQQQTQSQMQRDTQFVKVKQEHETDQPTSSSFSNTQESNPYYSQRPQSQDDSALQPPADNSEDDEEVDFADSSFEEEQPPVATLLPIKSENNSPVRVKAEDEEWEYVPDQDVEMLSSEAAKEIFDRPSSPDFGEDDNNLEQEQQQRRPVSPDFGDDTAMLDAGAAAAQTFDSYEEDDIIDMSEQPLSPEFGSIEEDEDPKESFFASLSLEEIQTSDFLSLVQAKERLLGRLRAENFTFVEVPCIQPEDNLYMTLSTASVGSPIDTFRIKRRLHEHTGVSILRGDRGSNASALLQAYCDLYNRTITLIRSANEAEDFVFTPQASSTSTATKLSQFSNPLLVTALSANGKLVFDVLTDYEAHSRIPSKDSSLDGMSIDGSKLRATLEQLQTSLDKLFKESKDPLLQRSWNTSWRQDLVQLQEEAENITDCRICFVGGMGAGKSFLLNRCVGEEVVRSGTTGRAMTSAITEVAYKAGQMNYTVEVEFLDIEDWYQELENSEQDHESIAQLEVEISDGKLDEAFSGLQDKIKKMYSTKDANSLISTIKKASKKDSKLAELQKRIEKLKSKLLPGFKKAFDMRKIVHQTNIDQLSSYVSQYSTSYEEGSADFDGIKELWIIVKRIRVFGPFNRIKGITLVDVPGEGDTNPRRRQLVEEEKKNCNNLWIIGNFSRIASNQDAQNAMRQHLKQSAIMRNKLSSCAVIATRCEVEDHQINEMASEAAIPLATIKALDLDTLLDLKKQIVRRSFAQSQIAFANSLQGTECQIRKDDDEDDVDSDDEDEVDEDDDSPPAKRQKLDPSAAQAAEAAQSNPNDSHEHGHFDLKAIAYSIPFFLVSSKMFQQEMESGTYDPIRNRSGFAPMLAFLHETAEKHVAAIQSILFKAVEYIGRLKRSMDDTINQPVVDLSKKLGEEAFKSIVEAKLEELCASTIKNLEPKWDLRRTQLQFFRDKMGVVGGATGAAASAEATRIRQEIVTQMVATIDNVKSKGVTAATLGAVCKHHGAYKSTGKAGPVDFNTDIATPLQVKVTAAWGEFFTYLSDTHVGNFIGNVLMYMASAIHQIHSLNLEERFGIRVNLDDLLQSMQNRVTQSRETLRNDIKTKRNELADSFVTIVQECMEPAYEAGGKIGGKGMLVNILTLLKNHVQGQGATNIFARVERDIVDEVTKHVDELFGHMKTLIQGIFDSILKELRLRFDMQRQEKQKEALAFREMASKLLLEVDQIKEQTFDAMFLRHAKSIFEKRGRSTPAAGAADAAAAVPSSAPSESLPGVKTEAAASSQDQKKETCPICLETPVEVMVDPCSHQFCEACIRRVLNSASTLCPLCQLSNHGILPLVPKLHSKQQE